MKKVCSFYSDLAIVWGLFTALFVLFNAHTTAKKTNVSLAYLQIFKNKSLENLEHDNHYDRTYKDDDFIGNKKPDISTTPSKDDDQKKL